MTSLGQGLGQLFGVPTKPSLYRQLTAAWADHYIGVIDEADSIHLLGGHSVRTAKRNYGASSTDFLFLSKKNQVVSFTTSVKWQELLTIPTEMVRVTDDNTNLIDAAPVHDAASVHDVAPVHDFQANERLSESFHDHDNLTNDIDHG